MSFDSRALLELGRALRESGYQFTTVTPATHALVNQRPGNEWATDLRGVMGWSRPFRNDLIPPRLLELMHAAGILVPHGEGWRSQVRASTLQGQLFFHSAFPTDGAGAVFFGPDTCRFAGAIGRHLASTGGAIHRAVDIGCGAGPGAILLARAFPQAQVVAADINPQALELSRVNAQLAATVNVDIVLSNLLQDVPGDFDLVVANPPYLLDASQRTYRHGGGSHGEALSLAIVEQASRRLTPGGSLLLYTGVAIVDGHDPFREAAIQRLPAGMEHAYAEIDPDVFGEELALPAYQDVERIAAVVLKVLRPDTAS